MAVIQGLRLRRTRGAAAARLRRLRPLRPLRRLHAPGRLHWLLRVLATACVLVLASGSAAAADAPAPPIVPCGDPAPAPRPSTGAGIGPAVPDFAVWGTDTLAAGWVPPACLGWDAGSGTRLVVALAATLAHRGDAATLLARAGAVSRMVDIRYWSTTDGHWRALASEASAVDGHAADAPRRDDFAPSELQPGRVLHYRIDEQRTGAVTWRLRVLERSATRVVLAHDNVTPIRAFGFTLMPPGAMQAVDLLWRGADGRWSVYAITRFTDAASGLASRREASAVNRSVALYRHLAGLPTDLEPPAMR